MGEIKPGPQTSEFKYAAVAGLITTFGESLGIFDTTIFEEDPILMLIYRGIQLLVIGGISAYYITNRSGIKKVQQTPAPIIFENKTTREG